MYFTMYVYVLYYACISYTMYVCIYYTMCVYVCVILCMCVLRCYVCMYVLYYVCMYVLYYVCVCMFFARACLCLSLRLLTCAYLYVCIYCIFLYTSFCACVLSYIFLRLCCCMCATPLYACVWRIHCTLLFGCMYAPGPSRRATMYVCFSFVSVIIICVICIFFYRGLLLPHALLLLYSCIHILLSYAHSVRQAHRP